MKKLDLLISLQGQKIKWSGFDPNSDSHVLLFENGVAIALPDFELIDDIRSLADALLSESLSEAKQIVALDELLTADMGKTYEHADGN